MKSFIYIKKLKFFKQKNKKSILPIFTMTRLQVCFLIGVLGLHVETILTTIIGLECMKKQNVFFDEYEDK